MAVLRTMFVQLLVVALTWLAAKLKLAFTDSDIANAANWLSAVVIIVGVALVQYFLPWLWLKLNPKPADRTNEPPSTIGRIPALILLAGIGVGFLMFVNGCAQNETNRAAQGMIAVQTHALTVSDLLHNGAITPEQAKTMANLIHAERDAVTAYYAAIKSGDARQLAEAKAAMAAASSVAALELAKYRVTPIVLPK